MAAPHLEFEKDIVDLQDRIQELMESAEKRGMDVADEVRILKEKLQELRQETFRGLAPLERVQVARHPGRPYTLDYIQRVFTDFMEMHGDRSFRDDEAIVGGWARLDGRPVMVIGHQKGRDMKQNLRRNFGMPHPEGYRKALRLMRQAEKFGAPVITLIDTPGAYPGLGAEERGQAEAIAMNLREMARLRIPTVAVIIGEGGSGGALALAVADRVLMFEHAVYSVISPEGCAAILWRSAEHRAKAAQALRITSDDLLEFAVVDAVVPEPAGGAHSDWDLAASSLRRALVSAVEELEALDPETRRDRRWDRYESIGAWDEASDS